MKRKVGALEKVEGDLINLQYKIRRDPASYADDFNRQYEQYLQKRELFDKSPELLNESENEAFMEIIDLVSHVAYCYKEKTVNFPEELMQILREHHAVLKTEVQEKIISCLTMLRRKDVLDSATLLQTLFPLLTTTHSKSLRAFLFVRILSDVRAANQKATDHRLNRILQTVLFNLLIADRASPNGLWTVKLTRELWKRQVWTDAKAVEVMKEACMADNEKVVVGGVRFFLGGDKEREELLDEESSDEEVDRGQLKHQNTINKKTAKRKKDLAQALNAIKKKERKKNEPHPLNFSALHLLHDPQGFAESLFYKHLQSNKSKLNLEQRLLVLQLVSRLVGLHKLTIISLYSYYIKYLNPRQQSVTTFLACLAQSSHSFVPPDVLEPLVLKIANEFVSEASASEVASAGLNAIREVCARQPLAMTDTLLQDLVQYKNSKDKGVVMAAKGLLSLYREVGADLLKKRDRGKAASMGIQRNEIKERRFGEVEKGEIEGLDLLAKWKAEEKQRKRLEKGLPAEAESGEEEEDEDDGWNGWEVESNGSTDSGGWLPVDSDVEIEVSDSDEEPEAKKAKTEENDEENFSKLATSTILTPADFAKLQELRLEAALDKELGKRGKKTVAEKYHPDDGVTAENLESLAALSKRTTRDDKVAAAAAGKAGRDEHKSKEARRQERKAELGKSTTNKEKARKKNFLMTLGKARSKKKRSLMEQKRVMQAHVQRAKRGGRRGNNG